MSPSFVTILTNERDFAADQVIVHLDALGAAVRRLNVESARTGAVPEWEPTRGSGSPLVVWWRQFEEDVHPGNLGEVDDLLVERAQWRVWLSTLDVPESRWVNPIWAARRAENKIEQLTIARSVGMDVPATTVTNDRETALRFAARHGECVVKTLNSAYFAFSDQSFVFTESLEHTALDEPESWHRAPLIVQKRLTSAVDARVVSFGDSVFGASCEAPGVDWRKTPHQPDMWQSWDVPPTIAARCVEYRRAMGIEYAAFDFMIDGEQTWFLEANQAGEFSFIDRALDLGIANAFARRLVELGASGAE